MKTVLIIGAGFSGVITAARLLRQGNATIGKIIVADGCGTFARGMAYGAQNDDHTLNVPAADMSAFEEDSGDFLRFASRAGAAMAPGCFVPRRLYGDYLEDSLKRAEQQAAPHLPLERVHHYVTALDRPAPLSPWRATLEDGSVIVAEQVVLALGNFASANPRIANSAFYKSRQYIRNPWDAGRLQSIPPDAKILILGTGLTMVDTATALLKEKPRRSIIALSRRGLLPQPHRSPGAGAAGTGEALALGDGGATVRAHVRAIRRYSHWLAAQGRDWREGMAIVRSVASDIWQQYPEKERRRFLRHVWPYWDTHRHRISDDAHQRLNGAEERGHLTVLAGRVIDIDDRAGTVHVTVRRRGSLHATTIDADVVINCTGPCGDAGETGNLLVEQLIRAGSIRADALRLGVDVGADCAVVDKDGAPSDSLFYIGPWLKASYWEATSVPDLRRFARRLAQALSAASVLAISSVDGQSLVQTV